MKLHKNWNKNKSDLIDKQFKLEECFTFLVTSYRPSTKYPSSSGDSFADVMALGWLGG